MKRATERHAGGVITDKVSIHALMKRATYHLRQLHCLRVVSIHALMKRATSRFIVYIIPCLCVSIHALMKRATRAAQKNFHGASVSIHALMKRATPI